MKKLKNTREATRIVEEARHNQDCCNVDPIQTGTHTHNLLDIMNISAEDEQNINEMVRSILNPLFGEEKEDPILDRKLHRLMKIEAVNEITKTIKKKTIDNEFCEDLSIETEKSRDSETIIIRINGGVDGGIER